MKLSVLLNCPVCGEETKEIRPGWFLCREGIIFQDMKNLENIYDETYHYKYLFPRAKVLYKNQVNFFMPKIEENTPGREFLEIGSSNNLVLALVAERGWRPEKIDINKYHEDTYPTVVGDFEDYEFGRKFDCIWASHVFEHFKKPVPALQKTYNLLEEGGCVYISMPDVYYMLTNNGGHFHRKEHYIMWDMNRFIKEAEKEGFTLIYKGRNSQPGVFMTYNDFHVVLQKQEVVK